MAIITSESPNVLVKEIDLSGVVPAVTSSTGAFVGDFSWGPARQPILIGNENELVSTFGSPSLINDSSVPDYLSASMFLKYSTNLQVVREVSASARNATAQGTAQLIRNLDEWNDAKSGLAATHTFLAKYPGIVGNSLKVSICPRGDSAGVFDNWEYASSFDGRPATSAYVAGLSADSSVAFDEVHVAVIDEDGTLSGTKGTVLETFPYLSIATDAKTDDGSVNNVLDVLNNKSAYIWAAELPSVYTSTTSASFTAATNGGGTLSLPSTQSLASGVASDALGTSEYGTGFDLFEDENTTQVDFLIAPGVASSANQTTIVNDLVSIAQGIRKDCVVVASPARDDVVGISNTATIVTNITTWADTLTSSSYLIVDNNYLKVYDKYNDQYVFIPAASATAGIMAATDFNSAPWFSPAGSRRGQYLGVTSLAYNATKSQRDTLYKKSVNPIVNLPGQGVILYGDKTKLGRPSAFDRINVRRLFLVIERAIKSAAQNVLFEFNDEFTRAEFVNIVEPFLREIRGRRGITDFRVVADETNNTAEVVDNNQFVASIFIKPARSINYVTLNFVAVRTGVDFEEVVGTV